MSSGESDTGDFPPPGSTSVRFGPAFLRYSEEKDHFELMRPVFTITNEGDRLTKSEHPDPIGPIAVYRIKTKGDRMDLSLTSMTSGPPPEMRTSHPNTREPIHLTLVWWPGMDNRQ